MSMEASSKKEISRLIRISNEIVKLVLRSLILIKLILTYRKVDEGLNSN